MIKKGISLVGFKSINEVKEILEKYPELYFELSYNASKDFLDEVYPYIKDRTSSLHALCPRREFFPNLGSFSPSNIEWSNSMLLEDAETAIKFNASVIVLHPGYMSNDIIPTDNEKRLKYFENDTYKDYIEYKEGSICSYSYLTSSLYRDHFNKMKEEAISISSLLLKKGIKLGLENLNPRAGYLLIHPDEMIELSKEESLYLTLDIGHLWVTSQLFKLNFLEEVKRIMDTNKVVNVHLHSNPSNYSKKIFKDSHLSLDKFDLPYKETLKLLTSYNANLILETLEEPERNIKLLLERI